MMASMVLQMMVTQLSFAVLQGEDRTTTGRGASQGRQRVSEDCAPVGERYGGGYDMIGETDPGAWERDVEGPSAPFFVTHS